jgi:hypothetical protein
MSASESRIFLDFRLFVAQGCRLGALQQIGSYRGTPAIKSM